VPQEVLVHACWHADPVLEGAVQAPGVKGAQTNPAVLQSALVMHAIGEGITAPQPPTDETSVTHISRCWQSELL
jgi:hypothetical protein